MLDDFRGAKPYLFVVAEQLGDLVQVRAALRSASMRWRDVRCVERIDAQVVHCASRDSLCLFPCGNSLTAANDGAYWDSVAAQLPVHHGCGCENSATGFLKFDLLLFCEVDDLGSAELLPLVVAEQLGDLDSVQIRAS